MRKKGDRKRKFRSRFFILLLSLLLVLSSNILIGADFAEAKANHEIHYGKMNGEKIYKSVQISQGDTLWSIAEKYSDEHYQTIESYIDELKRINHLSSDRILEGHYLTIVYYV